MQGKFPIFGIPFVADRRQRILESIINLAHGPSASSVIFANAHVVVEGDRDEALHSILTNATLVVPDGVPISWVLRAKGLENAQRYSGPDLMEDVFARDPGARHFFIGSTVTTLEKIKNKFRGNGVGFHSPPFTSGGFDEKEKNKHLEMIEAARADYIWVGLGAPKQERYVVEMAQRARKGAWLAVGAAFDFYAGNKPRAPKYLQRLGLEWAFRMATEPRRLAGRYLSTNPVFIKLALEEIFSRRSHE